MYPRTTLILDALDECHLDERGKILDFLGSIPERISRPVRIYITSRPEGDIRDCLINIPNLEIQATDNEADIAKFVKQTIETNGPWKQLLQKSPRLKKEIVETLLTRSNGMFQWANLQIKQLLKERTEHGIRERLGKLPVDLKAAYDEIYEKIEDLGSHDRKLSLRALRWITCAYEPLTSEALLAAVHIDPQNGVLESFATTEAALLDWCANLIRIDSQQNPPVWRVTHLSVVEYLETHWTILEAHCFVAKASLVLLQETYGGKHEQASEPGDIFHPDHLLQKYVPHYWIPHVKTQEDQDADLQLVDLLKAFLGSLGKSSVQYRGWHRQFVSELWYPELSIEGIEPEDISPGTSTIFLACRLSFYTLLRDWWDNLTLIELPQLADSERSLLTLAASAGCEPICNKLCEVGMEVNMMCQSWSYGSALAAASVKGHVEIIRLLVNRGADINMLLRNQFFGSALEAAAAEGHIEIIRLLLATEQTLI